MLQSGDILSCIGKSYISKGIHAFTGGKTHTAVVIECWGKLYVVDAQRNGVNPKPLDEWKAKYNYDITVHRPIYPFDIKEKSIKAFSKVGLTAYDYKSLLIFQPIYITTGYWFGKRNEDANSRMYCSEFIGWLEDVADYWRMSPQDLFKYFISKDDKYFTFKLGLNDNY